MFRQRWKLILLFFSIFFFFLTVVSLLVTSAGGAPISGSIYETNLLLSMALLFMVLYIAARFRRKE
ncbi:hypothetical protein KP77_07990 [Jeotgalibacillus alimentarius]|uniref:Uncharacterized protein n=1 Tax=Jeotgalibacillus alimentarius TaxID=135826 RepID=A0A0C2VQT2_9BACL|nr:hypothetical protein [Jeotgalibacillus alimentarius]KIL51287.1 hypothetical protein KP77_07990 [Jeotgalibacillus alimentarius]